MKFPLSLLVAQLVSALLGTVSEPLLAQSHSPLSAISSYPEGGTETSGTFGHFYGNLEIMHSQRTFVADQDNDTMSLPALQAKFQPGVQFGEGVWDFYATFGVIKTPGTRKLIQKRPEVELDFYPLRVDYGVIAIYNRVELPFSETEFDPDNAEVARQGSVYTLGVNPKLQIPYRAGQTNFLFVLAGDVWGSLLSRHEYVDETEGYRSEDKAFFLTQAENGEPVEASVAPLQNEWTAGIGAFPFVVQNLLAEIAVVSSHKYTPLYFVDDEGSVKFRYRPERTSYYRLSMSYMFSKVLKLSNEFYHFHKGFFAEKQRGLDEHRFHNLAKLVYQF